MFPEIPICLFDFSLNITGTCYRNELRIIYCCAVDYCVSAGRLHCWLDYKIAKTRWDILLFVIFHSFAFLLVVMSAGPIESQVSIGFGESGGTERPGAKAILPERSDHSLDNVCCLLLYCKTHRRLAVKRMSKGLFLPYRAYRPNESWRRVTAALRNRILEQFGNDANCGRGRCSEPEMLDIFRVQWPKSRQWYTRLTVLIKMEAEIMSPSTQHPKMAPKSPNKRSPKTETEKKKGSRCYCRVSTSSIIWMGAEELAKHINKFWGPWRWQGEVEEYQSIIKSLP